MDYSWNHTGIMFWAWRDVLKNQKSSKYADWYEVERFDDPATPDTNEFSYRGWAGVPWLPEWKKVGRPDGLKHGPIDGNLVPAVKDMIFSVTRRWLDPNGDGNHSDGVDGFRLDVADVVPLGFWRDYRKFVRGINPDAYLVGEVWWEQWPDKLWDPAPWVQGDVFDAVMHYQWYSPTRNFFAGAPPRLSPTQYRSAIDSLGNGIAPEFQRDMMNLAASHDTPRMNTSIYNGGKFKYHEGPREDSTYKIDRPDARTRRVQEMILVQQFTFIGAPHIWNGDEVGMWGADDPDERKPVVWSDLKYDDEITHPFGRARHHDKVEPDTALLAVYQRLIELRKNHLRLFVDGKFKWLVSDDAKEVIAYERLLGDTVAVVAFNLSDKTQTVSLGATGKYRLVYPAGNEARELSSLQLPAKSALVWMRE
jgi:glycosidase